MTFKTFQQCSQSTGWKEIEIESSSGGQYTVVVPPWGDNDAVCDCRGFHFRGHCRHIQEASERYCDWSSLKRDIQNDKQKMLSICPECGSNTITLTVEVQNGKDQKEDN